jgi:hypothetical protein
MHRSSRFTGAAAWRSASRTCSTRTAKKVAVATGSAVILPCRPATVTTELTLPDLAGSLTLPDLAGSEDDEERP